MERRLPHARGAVFLPAQWYAMVPEHQRTSSHLERKPRARPGDTPRGLTGIDVGLNDTSFDLGRETLIATRRSGMWRWLAALFSFLSHNSHTATEFFGLPPGRVVELGMQVEL